MKIYLIMHKGSSQWHKLESWVDIEKVGKNGISVISVRAFTKRKYAADWIKERKYKDLIIKPVTINYNIN